MHLCPSLRCPCGCPDPRLRAEAPKKWCQSAPRGRKRTTITRPSLRILVSIRASGADQRSASGRAQTEADAPVIGHEAIAGGLCTSGRPHPAGRAQTRADAARRKSLGCQPRKGLHRSGSRPSGRMRQSYAIAPCTGSAAPAVRWILGPAGLRFRAAPGPADRPQHPATFLPQSRRCCARFHRLFPRPPPGMAGPARRAGLIRVEGVR